MRVYLYKMLLDNIFNISRRPTMNLKGHKIMKVIRNQKYFCSGYFCLFPFILFLSRHVSSIVLSSYQHIWLFINMLKTRL